MNRKLWKWWCFDTFQWPLSLCICENFIVCFAVCFAVCEANQSLLLKKVLKIAKRWRFSGQATKPWTMAISSDQVKVTQFESPDCSSLEKIRWSIQQSLRKQLSQLSSDFFDVVDDFLFLNGQQGQSADNWIYLRSMRELCAKQVLFEETFLDQLIQTTETSHRNCALKAGEVEPSSIQKQPEVHEGIEIDRAIQAMSRRAMKSHRLFIQQIN